VTPYITNDSIIDWYRPTLKGLDSNAPETTMTKTNSSTGNYFKCRPNGWETAEDKVFVVTLLI
jgi:hypothetical protein